MTSATLIDWSTRIVSNEDLQNAERVGGDMAPHIYKLDEGTVAKFAGGVRMAEAAAMRFVREKTSIPVPEIYNSYIDADGRGCILMEYVPGDVLRDIWGEMSESQKDSIVLQLKEFMEDLRKIKGEFIGSVDRTYCWDQLFTDPPESYGPYETESAFNEDIMYVIRKARPGNFTESIVSRIKNMPKHEIVFTHSDLSPRNIIVRDGKVVAILDWEMAGFYPEYWEYVKALYKPEWNDPWVKDNAIAQIIKPYHFEHSIYIQVDYLESGF